MLVFSRSSARRTTSALEERSTPRQSARTASTPCLAPTIPGTVIARIAPPPSKTPGMSASAYATPVSTRSTAGCTPWAAGTAGCARWASFASITRTEPALSTARRSGSPSLTRTVSAILDTGTPQLAGRNRRFARTVLPTTTAPARGMSRRAWPTRCPRRSQATTPGATAISGTRA